MRVERTKLYHKQINTYKMRKRFGGGGRGCGETERRVRLAAKFWNDE